VSSIELPVRYEPVTEFRRRNGNIPHSFAYKLAGEGKIRQDAGRYRVFAALFRGQHGRMP
jgi:hypothetical protein